MESMYTNAPAHYVCITLTVSLKASTAIRKQTQALVLTPSQTPAPTLTQALSQTPALTPIQSRLERGVGFG